MEHRVEGTMKSSFTYSYNTSTDSLTSHFRSYGLIGFLSLALDLFRTKIFFRGTRLIRFPIFVRGRRSIDFGTRFSSGRGLRIEAFPDSGTTSCLIRIGKDVRINEDVHIGAMRSIVIGDRVLIASNVFITDHNHGSYSGIPPQSDPHVPPQDRILSCANVIIGDDVWIGEYVVVLPGVQIGKGSIIGAMTTVTRDIPPYSIAVGSPARVIKHYNTQTSTWERI